MIAAVSGMSVIEKRARERRERAVAWAPSLAGRGRRVRIGGRMVLCQGVQPGGIKRAAEGRRREEGKRERRKKREEWLKSP